MAKIVMKGVIRIVTVGHVIQSVDVVRMGVNQGFKAIHVIKVKCLVSGLVV